MKPELIAGSGGIFDIHADGQPIYLKSKTGTFPRDEEVVAMLRHKAKK